MKRVVNLILMLALTLSFVCPAHAATSAYTPSVTAKPAPTVVAKDNPAGFPVIEVTDQNDAIIQAFDISHVVVTAVLEKDKPHVDKEVNAELTEIYEQLSEKNVKLNEIMPNLDDVVKKATEEDKLHRNVNVNRLVVKDLFNVSVTEDVKKVMKEEGNSLKLTFDANVTQDQFLLVMLYVDGEWRSVDFEINEDGTITCAFKTVGTVALLVDSKILA